MKHHLDGFEKYNYLCAYTLFTSDSHLHIQIVIRININRSESFWVSLDRIYKLKITVR